MGVRTDLRVLTLNQQANTASLHTKHEDVTAAGLQVPGTLQEGFKVKIQLDTLNRETPHSKFGTVWIQGHTFQSCPGFDIYWVYFITSAIVERIFLIIFFWPVFLWHPSLRWLWPAWGLPYAVFTILWKRNSSHKYPWYLQLQEEGPWVP